MAGEWYHLILSREILSQCSRGRGLSIGAKDWDEHIRVGGLQGINKPVVLSSTLSLSLFCPIILFCQLDMLYISSPHVTSLEFLWSACPVIGLQFAPKTLFPSLMFCPSSLYYRLCYSFLCPSKPLLRTSFLSPLF